MLRAERHRTLIVGVVLTTAYVLAARLGFGVAFTAEQVTTVWAPTGIAQAALLIWGRRLWPTVWLGAFIANATTDAPVWTAAVIAAGNTLEAVALTWLLPRSRFDPSLSRVADVVRLIGFGAIVTTAISATVGVTTLCAAAQQPWDRYGALWSAWWIGDALGSLVIAPVILTIFRPARDRSTRDWLGAAVMAAGALAITELIFSDALGPTFGSGPLHYVLFPLVILAAVRFGQPATALTVLSAAAATIINTVGGTGPFATADVHQGLIQLQVYMGVLAATGLLLAAAITERHTTQRRLSAAHAVLDAALDAVIAMDHRGVVTDFNPAAERMFGYRRADAVGRELAELVIPPDLRDRHRQGLARYLQTGEGPFLNRRIETYGYHADGHQFNIEISITTLAQDAGPPRFTGFVRDLTARVAAERERTQAEEALRVSEERFRSLAASTTALTLYEQDGDLRYRWVFPQHPEFNAHNIGKTDNELLPHGEGESLTRLKQAVLDTGVGRREEISVTLQNDTYYYDLMAEPRRDRSGAVIGVGGVAIDITERKRNEQLLRHSQQQLRDADRRKDEFLAILAHELRNPLAPIRTGLEVLRRAGDQGDAFERMRPMMERQIAHMVRLIDDLLDVSRITSGKIHLQKEPASLHAMVDAAIEANRAAIESSGAQFTLVLPEEPVLATVDPTRFVQVLSNLLNNAAKFTDAKGRVTVTATTARDGAGSEELYVTVADTGAGIDAELLPRVFELFTQGERHDGRAAGGLGIGLALAQRIMELHGGTIAATSGGRGHGSTITLRLPLGRSLAAAADQDPRGEAPSAMLVNRRILVVDDHVDAVEMLAWLLRSYGGEVRTAHDGPTAVSAARDFAPHVILLDIGMPGMDGYETCNRIRAAEQHQRAFIVAITGWGQDRDKVRATAAGFDAHITKPADPAALQELLAGDLRRS